MKITLLIGLLLVAVVILVPFLVLWGLNTLFPALAIPYTFDTWLAVNLLGMFFSLTVRGAVK